MRVLRDREEIVERDAFVRRLGVLARGEPLAFLVELGIFEQAMLDARAVRHDEHGPVERALSRAAIAGGAACLGDGSGAGRALAIVESVAPRLPARARARWPEGYLHFALDPLAYAGAARAYALEVGRERARSALVVGVRSIGTSLSAIVAAAIGTQARCTLRPRGESGSRSVRVGSALAAMVRARGGDVLVVDEGPGVTGETFERVARWLLALGVPSERIRLVPSHLGSPAIAPEARRSFLASFRRHAPPLRDERPGRLAARLDLELGAEIGAGAWRAVVGADAPTRGVFERRKILARARGRLVLLRWSGLGAPAERALELASALARSGHCAAPIEAHGGFALWPWIDGRPGARGPAPADLRAALARYLAARARLGRTGAAALREPIAGMLRENAGEARLDPSPALRLLDALPEREAVVVDGRLAPWEWLRTARGWLKVDAVDHGDGIHLPGPADAAWDLAGAWIEHELDDRDAEAIAPDRESLAAARAYLAPYAACALGDAVLVARAAPPAEQSVLRREVAFYRAALERALARAGAHAPAATFSVAARGSHAARAGACSEAGARIEL